MLEGEFNITFCDMVRQWLVLQVSDCLFGFVNQ
jgi:hypothetical protein